MPGAHGMELAPLPADSGIVGTDEMNNNSHRPPFRRALAAAEERSPLERQQRNAPEPVSDYFTLYLLQELLSSLGWRHKH